MRKFFLVLFLVLPTARIATGAETVPTIIQMPGTQPLEVSNLESAGKCDNCHGGYNSAVEPAHNWQGSMMAQAGRDPIFWATLAIAEQDLDGSGDLCLRCHSTSGWLAGRSTPTDGSGLAASDSDGVECDYCHKLTHPDSLEHAGVMNEPFVASDGSEAYLGSGMSSMWGGSDKLGPYDDADARHQFMRSAFHRDPSFCGTCHDVSNPAVGNVAPNRGTLTTGADVIADDSLTGPVDGKAAFNNPPYAYGIVERTFSEHISSALPGMLVDDFPGSELPRNGAFEAIYLASTDNGVRSANYTAPQQDRTYTCQTCHMRAVTGAGANKRGVPVRHDLPLHDMTGGNYWMSEAIIWLDSQGKLRLGGGLDANQIDAMRDAAQRAREQLMLAATLEWEGTELKIVNHTGHKLITGYPEGRRMWLNVRWYDETGSKIREDGAYGKLSTSIEGKGVQPESILDLDDPELHIFEAHMGMSSDWAAVLEGLPHLDSSLPLSYDRMTGDPVLTLGELADPVNGPGHAATFHFVLNNIVESDNRIPPYMMNHATASIRNATPVPDSQYRDSDSDPVYDHYAEIDLNPPAGAISAAIDLMYQPTSWEYIQFLHLANKRNNPFLADEGENMLDAWIATGMAAPFVMTSTTWGAAPPEPPCEATAPVLTGATSSPNSITLAWPPVADAQSYYIYYDQSDKSQPLAETGCSSQTCSSTDSGLTSGQSYCYKITADINSCESAFSNILCATTEQPGQTPVAAVPSISTGSVIRSGKGKHATEEYVASTTFDAGSAIIIRMLIEDQAGTPVADASVNLSVSGPVSTSLVSTVSGADGVAEAIWTTEAPNKKGRGGTPAGNYTITVNGLNSSTHDWDGSATFTVITLQ
jgi:hypothetical protein